MINSISKPKIPKAYMFVLKTSQLEAFLKQDNESIHVDLIYWMPTSIGSIFEVHFWKPNENFDHNRLYIRAGALPKNNAAAVKPKLETEVFPRFLEWLNPHDNLPIHSPLLNKEPYFNAKYTEKGLIIEELYM